MNDILHTSLHRAVDAAIDQAMTPDAMRTAVAERVRAKRRRRPGLVIGSTLGSLALVGGTAFAAVQLLGNDDRPPVPDVIGSPRPETPTTTTPTDEPTPEPVATLPIANPDAAFPDCGAILDPPTGLKGVSLTAPEAPVPFGSTDASVPLGTSLEIRSLNEELYAGIGQATVPVLVAVKDGVVVGSFSADPTQVPIEMAGDGGVFPITTGTVQTTLCSDPSTPLPEGRYSIWAAQDLTFSDVHYFDSDWPEVYVPVDPITPNVPYRALSQVASLWMDGAGRSVGNPGLAAGWPAAVLPAEAFAPGSSDLQSIVWLAASLGRNSVRTFDAALLPSRDALLDLGYTATKIPFECQTGLDAIGVDQAALQDFRGYGAALVFPSATEAQTFVDLWEPLHGPVLGVVTGGIGEATEGGALFGWYDVECLPF